MTFSVPSAYAPKYWEIFKIENQVLMHGATKKPGFKALNHLIV